MQWTTLPRFDCLVCGRSAYPPILSVIADMAARQPRAKRRPERVQQNRSFTLGTRVTLQPPRSSVRAAFPHTGGRARTCQNALNEPACPPFADQARYGCWEC